MWLAIIISFLSYLAIWIHLRISKDNLTREEKSVIKNTVRAIGWYPVAYTIVVAPQSVIRFLQFQSGRERPSEGWVLLTTAFFSSGGTLNVLLWYWTGRRFGIQPATDEGSQLGSSGMSNVQSSVRMSV